MATADLSDRPVQPFDGGRAAPLRVGPGGVDNGRAGATGRLVNRDHVFYLSPGLAPRRRADTGRPGGLLG